MDPFIIVLLLALGLTALLVTGIGRRPAPDETRPLLPRLVAGAALVGSLLATLTGVVTVVLTFVGDRVTLAVPVIARIETVPDALRATPEASILSGTAQQSPLMLAVAVAGLDLTTRVLAALQTATLTAVVVTILVMTARVARQSYAAEPFSRSLSRLLIAGGATLAVGATLAQALGNAAGARAHEQLFFLRPGAFDGVENVPPSWSLDLWPAGVGLVLIVVAGLIRSGERLQNETRGLV